MRERAATDSLPAVDVARIALLFVSGLAAGVMNSIAGGGTIITFPALIFSGIPSIVANATSTLALLPGTVAGVAGYRQSLPAVVRWIKLFAPVSLAGGLLGSILLTRTPAPLFDRLVPFLILFATALFTTRALFVRLLKLEARGSAHAHSRGWLAGAMAFQFAVSVYGGYFGAGIGILMLATLGLLGFDDIHEMNAVKGVLGFLINAVAAAYFVCAGLVSWGPAAIVATGAMIGGFSGAHLAQKIPQPVVRHLVTAVGVFITAMMFYEQLHRR